METEVSIRRVRNADHKFKCVCIKCKGDYGWSNLHILWYCKQCLPKEYKNKGKILAIKKEK